MPGQLFVHLLPAVTSPQELAGNTVVVIDILRATTTIVHALAAGAHEVVPCLEVADARELARKWARPTVLGGERRGLPIKGFDLGNSPGEYQAETVQGKSVIMTTTNGTRAMAICTGADRVLIGSFCNLTACCKAVHSATNIHLLCAGTQGQITREDALFAGAVVQWLLQASPDTTHNDEARIVAELWNAAMGTSHEPARLAKHLLNSQGGRNVSAIGLEADIEDAAAIDRFDVLPVLEQATWSIRAGESPATRADSS